VVDLQGVRIGNVTRVHIASHPPNSTYPVRIDMQVEANHSRWLRTNSQVELGTTTFLGETIVNIRPGTSAAPGRGQRHGAAGDECHRHFAVAGLQPQRSAERQ